MNAVLTVSLYLILSLIFLWKSYEGIQKYFEAKIMVTSEEKALTDLKFPSFTFCPKYSNPKTQEDENWEGYGYFEGSMHCSVT